MGKSFSEKIDKLEDDTLKELLPQLTEPQRDLFNKCYPNGVPRSKMVNAIDVCERTVKKNNE